MRTITRLGISAVALLGVAACDRVVEPVIEAPTNLTYRLEPSGDPEAPAGLILSWDPVLNARLAVYRVYSRGQDGAVYDLRGETTSTTFHDAGVPDLDYYVVGVDTDGNEGAPSQPVRVDERLRLAKPAWLKSVTLNGAIHLYWSDNPFQSTPDGFKQYRIYSASYTLDDPENCGQVWTLEGTTVSPEFLASALTNGVSRCFGVSAESIEGWESLWSEVIADTPRPDARNVLIFPFQADPDRSGFRFFLAAHGDGQAGPLELGIVAAGDNPNMDFWVDRDAAGDLWITPVRAGTEVALYGTAPVADLTSIDVAPVNGYARTAIQAVPGYGYVFRMSGGDSYARYGALRVTHASSQYLIFDWSYQTDPGNPELSVRGGLPTFEGIVVRPGR
ncbi:MAG: hypothetical protein HYW06_09210 [Gemmatimonadetes bacterium]|nr:hypothetical protein [Gemmatimonadota bacterium]